MNDSIEPEVLQSGLDISDLAHLLKAAGDDLRLEILRTLSRDSFGVLELCRLFDTKQSGMSHHLKVLSNANLVSTRKEGNSIFYRRAPIGTNEKFAAIKHAIYNNVDTLPISTKTASNVADVYKHRSEASVNFFSENAERFKQQQDLIASFDVYGAHVAEVLGNAKLPSFEVALEVGPGAGEFLSYLCEKFSHTTALDNSSQMLAESRKRCAQIAPGKIDFVLNDTRYCKDIPNSVDCAIINMVLHHTPSPQQTFSEVAYALKPQGILIICDLCQHNQDWTREACGDLWLGFAPEDLSTWAENNDLAEGQSSYFALRNGFQIQIREFIKRINSN